MINVTTEPALRLHLDLSRYRAATPATSTTKKSAKYRPRSEESGLDAVQDRQASRKVTLEDHHSHQHCVHNHSPSCTLRMLLISAMDVNLKLDSDEVRREEPVALECALASQTKTLCKSDAPAAAPTILSSTSIAAQDDLILPLNEMRTPASRAPDPEFHASKAASPENPLINATHVDLEPLHPWYAGSRSNVPQTLDLRFLDQSPTSSNSSDGSSLFGSPTANSPGARSTSSGVYGCDSTSSSRDVSPFGSPSGSCPVFRFAFPKDGTNTPGLLATSILNLASSTHS